LDGTLPPTEEDILIISNTIIANPYLSFGSKGFCGVAVAREILIQLWNPPSLEPWCFGNLFFGNFSAESVCTSGTGTILLRCA
jgi:hypothetical protein